MTVQYVHELRPAGVLVNAVDPGHVDTEINAHTGYLPVEQGAAVLVRLATPGREGPTGGFSGADGPLP